VSFVFEEKQNTFYFDELSWEDNTIGSGSFGEVRICCLPGNAKRLAAKLVDIEGLSENEYKFIRKEWQIHGRLQHKNIIKAYWAFADYGYFFIFMDLLCGGTLYDLIELDVGMPLHLAHNYFCQLIAGVDYIHNFGVVHRDIKPSNIMFDTKGVLKIIDFGCASRYEKDGKIRKIHNIQGSHFYMAPEIPGMDYDATPVDVFSCGIVLAVMLAGDVPWSKAVMTDIDYKHWVEGRCELRKPWNRVTPLSLSLLKEMLSHNVDDRSTISDIKKHKFWDTPDYDMCNYEKRKNKYYEKALTQPDPDIQADKLETVKQLVKRKPQQHTSQPLPNHNLVLSPSQVPLSPPEPSQSTKGIGIHKLKGHVLPSEYYHNLPKRLTRIWTRIGLEEIVGRIQEMSVKLGMKFLRTHPDQVCLTMRDPRQNRLQLRAVIYTSLKHCPKSGNKSEGKICNFEVKKKSLIETESNNNIRPKKLHHNKLILIDFMLGKGDGFEFKRMYKRIYNILKPIEVKRPPKIPVKCVLKDWNFHQTIGQGAYGKVKVAYKKNDGPFAAKIVQIENLPHFLQCQLKEEVLLHKGLDHKNIIKYYNCCCEDEIVYIFMEFGSGGNLYNHLKPDFGVPLYKAHNYFRQVIAGVEYLHELGITHRDMKIENIIIGQNNLLKIIDFGFATRFKGKNGQQIIIKTFAGTKGYRAPEVANEIRHLAEPAEIFSVGCLLSVLLTGNIPWEDTIKTDCEFKKWCEGKRHHKPWCNLTPLTLLFLNAILIEKPDGRMTIKKIKSHKFWKNPDYNLCTYAERIKEDTADKSLTSIRKRRASAIARSKGIISSKRRCPPQLTSNSNVLLSSSQTTHMKNLSMCSERFVLTTNPTRLWTKLGKDEVVNRLKQMCNVVGVEVEQQNMNEMIMVAEMLQLKFCARLIERNKCEVETSFPIDYVVVDFDLIKGHGLDFRRLYEERIYSELKDIEARVPYSKSCLEL